MSKVETFAEMFEELRGSVEYYIEGATLEFTEQVIARMKETKTTPEVLAEKLGESVEWLNKLFAGGKPLNLENMTRVALALDCKVDLEMVPFGSVATAKLGVKIYNIVEAVNQKTQCEQVVSDGAVPVIHPKTHEGIRD